MKLHELKPSTGSRQKRKRVGRGIGSGRGKTATRGTKGQLSRSGSSTPGWFEGGKMPLQRLIPKRGFKNYTRKEYVVFNLDRILNLNIDDVTPEVLFEKRMIKKKQKVKILGVGDIDKKINVKVHAISNTAKEKILKAGGQVELITKGSNK